MSWENDIQVAKYTSPAGAEFEFKWEALEINVDKKTATFNFAEKDGVYIQDLGRAGRSFPFTLFFIGEDYHTESENFLLALEEKGIGKLEHPLYGNRDVIPTGKLTRRDDLITGAGQAIFNITFSETIKDIFFPSNEIDATNNISNNLDELQQTQSEKYAKDIESVTVGDTINLATRIEKQLEIFDSKVQDIIDYTEEIKTEYETIKSSLEASITEIFDEAEEIVYQGISLYRLTANTIMDIKEKADIYINIVQDVIADFEDGISNIRGLTNNNNFFETNKNIIACAGALCESVLYTTFQTRNDVIEVSETILDFFDDIKDFQDTYLEALGLVDTGEDYYLLSNLISIVTGYLISISFNLPLKKSVILGEETNIITLCAELYGDLSKLDYLMDTNNLNINEIEFLPTNKEIIYYE